MWCGIALFSTISTLSARYIFVRFKILNEIAEKSFLNRHAQIISINLLAAQHIELCHITRIFNKIYSVLMAVLLGVCLMATTFSLYEPYDIFKQGKEDVAFRIYFTVVAIVVNIYYFLLDLIFVACCVKTMNEGEKTETIFLQSFYTGLQLYSRRKRSLLFIQQLSHIKPSFTCGLFKFNWKLIHSVSSSFIQIF